MTIDMAEQGGMPANCQIDASQLRSSAWAYVGGVTTTLRRLDHITDEERQEWWQRIEDVLGPPEGGFAVAPAAG